LFFVLSGFLISNLLFRDIQERGRIRLWRFLIRREWELLPSFFLYLAAVLAVVTGRPAMSIRYAALFIYNYAPGSGLESLLSHVWSLAIEEHFCVLLPLLFLWLPLKHFKLFPAISVLLLPACGIGRYLEVSMFYTHCP